MHYVETSALLAALLEQNADAQQQLRTAEPRSTSALTLVEAHRAIIRARVEGRITAEQQAEAVRALRTFGERYDLIAMTPEVLARASRPFPVEPIRTLDAIHVATLEMIDESPALVTVLTRDHRVRENAVALGYRVV